MNLFARDPENVGYVCYDPKYCRYMKPEIKELIQPVGPVGERDYSVEYKKDTDVRKGIFRALAKAGCPILQMKDAGMSLEEMFLKLTTPTYTDKGGKR